MLFIINGSHTHKHFPSNFNVRSLYFYATNSPTHRDIIILFYYNLINNKLKRNFTWYNTYILLYYVFFLLKSVY